MMYANVWGNAWLCVYMYMPTYIDILQPCNMPFASAITAEFACVKCQNELRNFIAKSMRLKNYAHIHTYKHMHLHICVYIDMSKWVMYKSGNTFCSKHTLKAFIYEISNATAFVHVALHTYKHIHVHT